MRVAFDGTNTGSNIREQTRCCGDLVLDLFLGVQNAWIRSEKCSDNERGDARDNDKMAGLEFHGVPDIDALTRGDRCAKTPQGLRKFKACLRQIRRSALRRAPEGGVASGKIGGHMALRRAYSEKFAVPGTI